ncbi:MAG: hypothetical protein N2653_05185 [Burkholderiales bacterium]|nr:hypothetical protein [Burkholderiales bacterium]
MIRARLLAARERRAALCARAAAEREALEALLARTDVALRWIALGRDLGRALLARPWLVASAVALAVALRPRRALRWAAAAWSAVRVARGLVRAWRRFAPLAG